MNECTCKCHVSNNLCCVNCAPYDLDLRSMCFALRVRIDVLEDQQRERAHLINYKSYLALADRIEQLEKVMFSVSDISALQGQIDNIHKNDEFNAHAFNRLEERVTSLEEEERDIKIYSHSLQEKAWQENILKRLEKLEKWKLVAIEKNIQDVERITRLENIIKDNQG